MTEEEKKDVYNWVNISLSSIFPDAIERDMIMVSIFNDVVADIETTADEDFNSSDIDIALARVLYKRIVK